MAARSKSDRMYVSLRWTVTVRDAQGKPVEGLGAKDRPRAWPNCCSASMLPRHLAADDGKIHLARNRFVGYNSFGHYENPVGKQQQLIQILADQQDGSARVASLHQKVVNKVDSFEIEAEARVGRHQDP